MTRISADWVDASASRAVMQALGDAYFVGGCVRNALLEAPVSDIDIATPLVPEDVVQRIEAAGLKAVPTGLKHGTITVVHPEGVIEVTTFRADVATDGRWADVAFTQDMAVDAGRRDFTMNALYADATGEVIDPLGGLDDLHARRVRFIGRAEDRIREDYLRILRFFRFHAWYGAEGLDADGMAACAELAGGLDGLARERVGWEFRKLLSAVDPAPTVASMAASGVLARCLPGASPSALAPLVHLEAERGFAPNWQIRLMALGAENLEDRLRLSKVEAEAQRRISDALSVMAPPAVAAYRWGRDAAQAASLVLAASTGAPLADDLKEQIIRGAEAKFPIVAKDLLAIGFVPGPKLGKTLAACEADWIASDFSLDRAALLEKVRAIRSD